MRKYLYILFILFTLPSCVPTVMVAGSATAGAIAYDKRGWKVMQQDRYTSYRAQSLINADKQLKDKTHISVATFNRTLLLVGQAPTTNLRAHAYAVVSKLPKVKRIYNQIVISAPSSLMTRSSDAWITTKAKAELLAQRGLKSSQIKVLTENGVIYLMGLITRPQAKIAANRVRKITGVQKVVKVFQYI